MADQGAQAWFDEVWALREDQVYRALFGDLGQGVHTATSAHYSRLKQSPRHPGWLHHGVFGCPPHGDRAHWVYATSGLSNPWNLTAPGRDPSGDSGLGFELCLCTPDRAPWAIDVLQHLMAWQLLVATGASQGQPLATGQRVPLGGPVDGTAACRLTWVLVEPPGWSPTSFELPSGKVDWLCLVGVSEPEVAFARAHDQPQLVGRLRADGCWPLTSPGRRDVV
jgi:hypothetical protein